MKFLLLGLLLLPSAVLAQTTTDILDSAFDESVLEVSTTTDLVIETSTTSDSLFEPVLDDFVVDDEFVFEPESLSVGTEEPYNSLDPCGYSSSTACWVYTGVGYGDWLFIEIIKIFLLMFIPLGYISSIFKK